MAAKTADSRWFIRTVPNPRARLRLFCLPYAGGGASVFRSWSNVLPDYLEVCAVQLPGRENRVREQPFWHISGVIDILTELIRPYLNLPFAIFGHSVGAILAFELARQIRKVYRLTPTHLFVSAHIAPHLSSPEALHRLPDASFIEELRMYGGIPEVLLKEEELMRLLLPSIRADFAINETYVYSDGEPLECPISAFGGLHDPKVSSDYLTPWREHTCGPFSQHILPGNHFFLQSSKELLLKTIVDDLTRALGRMDAVTG
ncbi:MAG TPA: thioesterase domain-containing protein [Candidatus Binatia bacterium]